MLAPRPHLAPKTRLLGPSRLGAKLLDDRGLTSVEYLMILCLIAIVCFAIWKKFGQTVATKLRDSNTTMGTLSGTPSE